MKNATPIIKEACEIQGLKYPEEVDKLDARSLIRHTIHRCVDITNGSIAVNLEKEVNGEGALLLRSYFGI